MCMIILQNKKCWSTLCWRHNIETNAICVNWKRAWVFYRIELYVNIERFGLEALMAVIVILSFITSSVAKRPRANDVYNRLVWVKYSKVLICKLRQKLHRTIGRYRSKYLVDQMENVQRRCTERVLSQAHLFLLESLSILNLEPLEIRRLKLGLAL